MIHQLIFAAPKPGMSEEEFQRYWVEVHAVKYASKIPQIRKYQIDTRIPLPGETGAPEWSGIAEIWLENDEESLASLQTPEFIDGARADEPNWAAFWQTIALNTDATEVVSGPPLTRDQDWIKLAVLVKRREGLPLADFRARSLGTHADLVAKIPGLRRYLQCHQRDGNYAIGEALLDAAYLFWFDSVEALAEARETPEFKQAEEDLQSFVEPRYIHRMVAREHWIIGPEPR